METNDIIDDHLIHNPHEGLSRLQNIIRTSGIFAIIAAVLGFLGIFQQLFYLGQQVIRMMSASFDKYISYEISSMFFGSINIILEIILSVFLFRFGLIAVNAGKKVLGQQQWDTLFKNLRNILITIVGYLVVSLFSYMVNAFLQLIL